MSRCRVECSVAASAEAIISTHTLRLRVYIVCQGVKMKIKSVTALLQGYDSIKWGVM